MDDKCIVFAQVRELLGEGNVSVEANDTNNTAEGLCTTCRQRRQVGQSACVR